MKTSKIQQGRFLESALNREHKVIFDLSLRIMVVAALREALKEDQNAEM